MREVRTRGGVFGSGGWGGGVFDGSDSGFGGLGGPTYEQAAAGIGALGAMSYVVPDSIKSNIVFQTCIGPAFQKCGTAYSPGAEQDACLDAAAKACVKKAQASLGAAGLTSAQVKVLQQQINTALAKYGYCPIAVDGKLGPNTCGAAIWGSASGVAVPGACGTLGNNFHLQDCPGGKPASGNLPCPTDEQYYDATFGSSGDKCCPDGQKQDPHDITKCIPKAATTGGPGPGGAVVKGCPPGQMVDPGTGNCMAIPAKAKSSSSTAWIVGGLLAAAVVAGVAVAAQKKKKR